MKSKKVKIIGTLATFSSGFLCNILSNYYYEHNKTTVEAFIQETYEFLPYVILIGIFLIIGYVTYQLISRSIEDFASLIYELRNLAQELFRIFRTKLSVLAKLGFIMLLFGGGFMVAALVTKDGNSCRHDLTLNKEIEELAKFHDLDSFNQGINVELLSTNKFEITPISRRNSPSIHTRGSTSSPRYMFVFDLVNNSMVKAYKIVDDHAYEINKMKCERIPLLDLANYIYIIIEEIDEKVDYYRRK